MFRLFRLPSSGPKPKRRLQSARPRKVSLQVERLEERDAPATDVVTNLMDGAGMGPAGSLRNVLANAAAGDTIIFQAGLSGTLTLTNGALTLSQAITIQGPGPSVITINGNNAAGIFADTAVAGTSSTISGLTLTGVNTTVLAGAAVYDNASSLTLTNLVITGNTGSAAARASAVVVTGATASLTIQNSTISSNTETGAIGGGAVAALSNSTLTIQGSTLSGNTAMDNAAGIYAKQATTMVQNSTISGNRAAFGGGIFNQTGTTTVLGSTISGNYASSTGGGGIYLASGTVTLQNSTVASNSTAQKGGGIFSKATLNIQNSTVANNTATGVGGGIYLSAGTATLQSTIVAGNTAVGAANDVTTKAGSTLNASNDLFQTAPVVNGTFGTNTANLTGVNPMLGTLQNNGGPTFTLALLAGSPAIDAGSNPANLTTDQRGPGFSRTINGATDIGAYEFQPPATMTTVVTSLSPSTVGQTVTFTATVTPTGTGANVPQGTVTFLNGTTALGTVTLVNGMATFTTSSLPGGTLTITAQYNGFTQGNFTFTASMGTVTQIVLAGQPTTVIAGADAGGGPQITISNANGTAVATFFPFGPTFTGGVRVARADINGDGVLDVIAAAGPGGGPQVIVIDGTKLNQVQANGQIAASAILASFFAFTPTFTGGVYVAAATGANGKAVIVVGADAGGGSQVEVIDGTKLGQVSANGQIASSALLANFFAFLPTFTGGVRVAIGDVNKDGTLDIVCGAGPGGGPQVIVIDGTKLAQTQSNGQIANAALLTSFFAFAPTFTGGVYVTLGNTLGGTQLNLIVGAGAGGGPQVIVVDGTKLSQTQSNGQIANGSLLASFFALPSGFTGGVRVDTADVNGDGAADVVTGAGPGGGPQETIFDGPTQKTLGSFFALPSSFTGGIFV